jgi:hypothetical protein
MELLCIMHEAEPRGSLLINGRPVNDRQIASLAGASLDEAKALLDELETAGVFSRESDGTIFSRRMRRDDAKAARDKANGKGGGNPTLKVGVNPVDNGADKAQIPLLEPIPEIDSSVSVVEGRVLYTEPEADALAFEFDGIEGFHSVLGELVVWSFTLANCRTDAQRKSAVYGALKKRAAKASLVQRLKQPLGHDPPEPPKSALERFEQRRAARSRTPH